MIDTQFPAKIWREFSFESAHRIETVPEGHICWPLHGHTYTCRVTIEGTVQDGEPWFYDWELTEVIRSQLNHKYLNEIIPNPSTERIAAWILARVKDDAPSARIVVQLTEGHSSGVEVSG